MTPKQRVGEVDLLHTRLETVSADTHIEIAFRNDTSTFGRV
jgi:hypothetical protein